MCTVAIEGYRFQPTILNGQNNSVFISKNLVKLEIAFKLGVVLPEALNTESKTFLALSE